MTTCEAQGRVAEEMSINFDRRNYRYYDNYGHNDNG